MRAACRVPVLILYPLKLDEWPEASIADKATLCLNKVTLPSNQKYRFELPTKPTPLQARAGELLGVGLGA